MKKRLLVAVVAVALAGGSSGASATGLECPWNTLEGGQYTSEVSNLLPSGDAFEDIPKVNAAVYALRQQGIGAPLVIDTLISSYCPIVTANPSLDEKQKTAKLAAFVGRITRAVYSLESATDIILDVALPPEIVEAISVKARLANMSPEDWVASVASAAAQKKN